VIGIQIEFLGGSRPWHLFDEMGQSSEEVFVVIAIFVSSLREASESPSFGLSDEGREFGVFEVEGYDSQFKLSGVDDSPRSSVRHPADDAG